VQRDSLLPYKLKDIKFNDILNRKMIILNLYFDRSYYFIKDIIYKSFYKISNNFSWLKNFIKLFVSFSIRPNLYALLLNGNFKFNFNFSINKTSKCFDKNCRSCFFIYDKDHLTLNNNIIIPLCGNVNCKSKNIVYIIICNLCNIFYVGETSLSLNKRFINHLNCIRKFKITNMNTEVGYHFNKINHKIENNLRICIFKNNLVDSKERKSVETDLINFLNLFHNKCLNTKIASKYSLKKLCFS
jgi:hypothetical protein